MSSLVIALRGHRDRFKLDVDLKLPASGVTAIFGRSGSGKTTLLRAVAGLQRMVGHVSIGPTSWQTPDMFLPPEHRRVGYVFQEALLFPHLTVQANLEYALRRARARRTGLNDVVEWLGLATLLGRRPTTLSGGERQRVAIARALLSHPLLLLMDEPLAALDLQAKDSILCHLERLRDELDVPIVYVTHAVEEVARLANRVVWLQGGRARDFSAPEKLFGQLELGQELDRDAEALVSARISRHDASYHLTELDTAWGVMFTQRLQAKVGDKVRLRVRAGDVSIALAGEHKSSILNIFRATVARLSEVTPGEVLVQLACPDDPTQAVLARVTRKSLDELGLRPGLDVYARVKGVSVR